MSERLIAFLNSEEGTIYHFTKEDYSYLQSIGARETSYVKQCLDANLTWVFDYDYTSYAFPTEKAAKAGLKEVKRHIKVMENLIGKDN